MFALRSAPHGGDDTQCRAMYLALLLVQGPVTGMSKMSSSLLILAIALPVVPLEQQFKFMTEGYPE